MEFVVTRYLLTACVALYAVLVVMAVRRDLVRSKTPVTVLGFLLAFPVYLVLPLIDLNARYGFKVISRRDLTIKAYRLKETARLRNRTIKERHKIWYVTEKATALHPPLQVVLAANCVMFTVAFMGTLYTRIRWR